MVLFWQVNFLKKTMIKNSFCNNFFCLVVTRIFTFTPNKIFQKKSTMKKLLLLMTATIVAANINAQSLSNSVVRVGGIDKKENVYLNNGRQFSGAVRSNNGNTANKTTLGGSRWYNYIDWMSKLNASVLSNSAFPYMWFRPDMYGIYSDGTGGFVADTIEFATYAMTFDPVSNNTDFNSPTAYPGEIAVKTGNSYTLDSVKVRGIYGRNPAKAGIIDTLRFSFINGNGSSTNMPFYYFTGMMSNFGYDTVRFGAIWHNPSTNTALKNPGATGAPAVIVKDLLLTAASVNDTDVNGLNEFAVAANMSVPAGNYVGATVTFKSGDTYAAFSDTAYRGSINPTAPFKYGMFRPLFFEQNTSGFPTYTPGNWNMGHVKFLPESPSWDSMYVPAVAYTAGLTTEFPDMDFLVSCPTCNLTAVADVNTIQGVIGDAIPTPANQEVSISYSMNNSTDLNFTLNNSLGQLISSQRINKATNGKASFNLSNLSSGIYFCTVEANGLTTTKRIVVAH